MRGSDCRRAAMELLDKQEILADIPAATRDELESLTVLEEVDSTNRFLMQSEAFRAPGVHACIAEAQTAGRGRRGRAWVSPFGANLYLSVLRAFPAALDSLQALSLVTGVAVARAMESLNVNAIALKWPNDVLIGLNVDMPAEAGADIDQPWTDLARRGSNPGRNRLAARVLSELLPAQRIFIESGFEAFRPDWERLDALRDCQVQLETGSGRRSGTARGVDTDGALLLEVDGRRERVLSGEVSLRAVG